VATLWGTGDKLKSAEEVVTVCAVIFMSLQFIFGLIVPLLSALSEENLMVGRLISFPKKSKD
jgi:hypothetical protein